MPRQPNTNMKNGRIGDAKVISYSHANSHTPTVQGPLRVNKKLPNLLRYGIRDAITRPPSDLPILPISSRKMALKLSIDIVDLLVYLPPSWNQQVFIISKSHCFESLRKPKGKDRKLKGEW